MKLKTSAAFIYFIISLFSVWFGYGVILVATSILLPAYMEFGSELPSITQITLELSENNFPLLFAGFSTVLLLYLFVKQREHVLLASFLIVFLSLICVGFTLFSVSMPFMSSCAEIC